MKRRSSLITSFALVLFGCYASQPTGTDRTCTFTYEDTARDASATCRIPAESETTCFDAALCLCTAWSPDASDAEIQDCARWETTPRGAITFADVCGSTSPLTLAEALRGMAEVYGYEVHADEGCDDLPATLLDASD